MHIYETWVLHAQCSSKAFQIQASILDQLKEFNTFLAECGARRTRSGALSLRIPIPRITTYNRSFTVPVCRLWKSLPDSVKQIESREIVAELRRRYLNRMIVAGGGATLGTVTV
ncbi:hypothetical protein J6590_068799 [Homalodisca vitripennis]|nr:hypothetical protein J6590_068799 [Homalodisca vitripennis]